MLRRMLIAIVLCLPGASVAQQGNTVLLQFNGPPTGGCAPIMVATDTTTGNFYNCWLGAWNAVSSGFTKQLFLNTADFTDVTASSATRGDIITAQGASPKWTRLGIGGANTVLHGGTEPGYSAVVSADTTGTFPSTPHALLDGSVDSDTTAGAPSTGDIITGQASKWSRFGGNTTTTPNFYTSTGTGAVASAPTLTSSTGNGNVVLSLQAIFTPKTLDNVCYANGQTIGASADSNINACIASNTEIVYSGNGNAFSTILFNNVTYVHLRCTHGSAIFDQVTGNPAQPLIKITGTSQYIWIDGCNLEGNGATGVGGNGHAISILGTGGTPSNIYITNMPTDDSFNGTGINGTGGSIGAAVVYVYKSVNIFILNNDIMGDGQNGVVFDSGVANAHIENTAILRMAQHSVQTIGTPITNSDIIIGPNVDLESNAVNTTDDWALFDSCTRCVFWGNFIQSNAGLVLFSSTSTFCGWDIYDNYWIHGGGSNPSTVTVMDSAAACSLNIHDNFFQLNTASAAHFITLTPSTHDSKRIVDNRFSMISPLTVTTDAIGWAAGTQNGPCEISRNQFGESSQNYFAGAIAIDLNTTEIGCRVEDNMFWTNSGTLTTGVNIASTASNTIFSPGQKGGTGTITNLFLDASASTNCQGQGCNTSLLPVTHVLASASGNSSSTTLAQTGGMTIWSWNLTAGRPYHWDCDIYYQVSSLTGSPGLAMGSAGTATWTSIAYALEGYTNTTAVSEGTVVTTAGNKSSLAAAAASTTNLPVHFHGSGVVNAAGTLLIDFANLVGASSTVTLAVNSACTAAQGQ